jgi:uncharacterized BrkB/YihY/UPF0761 family membrane protein
MRLNARSIAQQGQSTLRYIHYKANYHHCYRSLSYILLLLLYIYFSLSLVLES